MFRPSTSTWATLPAGSGRAVAEGPGVGEGVAVALGAVEGVAAAGGVGSGGSVQPPTRIAIAIATRLMPDGQCRR